MPLEILENKRNKKIFIAIIIIALVITFATIIYVAVINFIPPDDNGGG
jgi:flagellar basal body-associated protein FliL